MKGVWLKVECKKCGRKGKIDSDVIAQYGWIWKCPICGMSWVYVPMVKGRQGRLKAFSG